METPVIIKGNNRGLRLIIPEDADVKHIVEYLKRKAYADCKQYYEQKPFEVIFEGKALTDDEKQCILHTLNIDNIQADKLYSQKLIDKTEKINNIPDDNCGLFFFGDIKNGQILETDESIIIVGDVAKGAKVYSQGNVIIIGQQKGLVISGCKGKNDTFVYSLV